MSDLSQKEAGVIMVLLNRLETQRLPRALVLKKKVDRGESLDETDMVFLNMVIEDSRNAQTLVAKHPEFQSLVTRLTELYGEITSKGLENAQNKS